MPILNLGFLAHVDAGKTSLTERILYETSVIDAIGRVDSGNTQTDTLELERQRGITIQSAVVSFRLGDLKVNLIDTPGHADFIAEVERALSVLDGVVIVISTVEGVQPQTRKLVQAVRSLDIPMVLFLNKIDRIGARDADLLDEIRSKLGLRVIPMNRPCNLGSSLAEVIPHDRDDPAFQALLIDRLSESSDDFVQSYLRGNGSLPRRVVRKELRAQVKRGDVAPAFFGSAITGAGVGYLLQGIAGLLPRAPECDRDAPSGTIFKIQRGASGEKLVFLRLFSGTLKTRQRIVRHPALPDREAIVTEVRITGIDRFEQGTSMPVQEAAAGEIVRLHGLREARIGDVIGRKRDTEMTATFAPPALESVVRPVHRHQVTGLYGALQQLVEQDPLIDVRRNERNHEISVRLFGEIQKEIITSMLTSDFGIDVVFETSQAICIERPGGSGSAIDYMGGPGNPFVATVGLRIDPGEPDSGVTFHRPSGALPLAFYKAIEETVYETLEEGLLGWRVTDCIVTVTQTAYASPVTVAADFRKLTPLVMMDALRDAGTRVHEPIQQFTLRVPLFAVGDALTALVAARAIPRETTEALDECVITGFIPAATMRPFEHKVPGLSAGNGVFSSRFSGYTPVTGPPPRRERTDFNPLNRKYYLAQVSQA